MMTYQNFKETVIAALASYMPEEYKEMQIVCRKKRRVNQELEVLACSVPNAHVNTVNICLEDAYNDYLENGHIVAMLRGMAKVLTEKFKMPLAPELDEIMLRNADQKIVFHLINTEQNRELLADVPHREFLDLSIVYELVVQMDETGIAFGMIKNDMARKLSMTEEQLFQHAYENTKKLLRLLFTTCYPCPSNSQQMNVRMMSVSLSQGHRHYGISEMQLQDMAQRPFFIQT